MSKLQLSFLPKDLIYLIVTGIPNSESPIMVQTTITHQTLQIPYVLHCFSINSNKLYTVTVYKVDNKSYNVLLVDYKQSGRKVIYIYHPTLVSGTFSSSVIKHWDCISKKYISGLSHMSIQQVIWLFSVRNVWLETWSTCYTHWI